jgi:hypothetical protein
MARNRPSDTRRARTSRLAQILVLCATLGVIHDAATEAQASGTRRKIYRDAFGNDLGPNIPPPRTTGGGWAVYGDGVNMGFGGPASSRGFRNYGLHNNLGDAFWPPY